MDDFFILGGEGVCCQEGFFCRGTEGRKTLDVRTMVVTSNGSNIVYPYYPPIVPPSSPEFVETP